MEDSKPPINSDNLGSDESSQLEQSIVKPVKDQSHVDLYEGSSLTIAEANIIARENRTCLIVVAGAHESGKTTLLASIWDKFQEGPYAGYLFSGSMTMPGFEKRCHFSRIASERIDADTPHTPFQDETILHLQLTPDALNDTKQELIFSDLAGERYRLAKDSIEECQKLDLLLRADHFALLIDGNKLISEVERHEAFTDARLLLQSCLDANMLGNNTFVNLIISKWDLIEDAANSTEVKSYVQMVENKMLARFGSRVGKLDIHRIAARPKRNSQLPYAHNLDTLLKKWAGTYPAKRFYEHENITLNDFEKEIERFAYSTHLV